MEVSTFNSLPNAQAREALALCCVSRRWIDAMLAGRPYASRAGLLAHSDAVWSELDQADFLEAFEGHPKIGDVGSLRAKYAASGALAAHEQSGVSEADEATIQRLARGNERYEQRFGFIFIVCASGKSAQQMCALLEQRLENERDAELRVAAEEQRKILTLRLEQML